MSAPFLAIASLGGTVTMTATKGGGVEPSLSADDLVAAVPELSRLTELVTSTIATKPGSSLNRDDLLRALAWARSSVDQGATGVIVLQGTDTIEESAYFFDLYWDRDEPLVMSGAMRHPSMASADGPANLLAAAATAIHPESQGRGVLVVMDETIHCASRVRKARGSGGSAFESVQFGPEGAVEEGHVHYRGLPLPRTPRTSPGPSAAISVPLIDTYLGDTGELVDLTAAAGATGLVLSAFGVGHVPAAVADAVARALPSVPVVFATRTGAGTTFRQTYGFSGSESDLLARGAIGAGWLQPNKARILLAECLAAGLDRNETACQFEQHGRTSLQGAKPRVQQFVEERS